MSTFDLAKREKNTQCSTLFRSYFTLFSSSKPASKVAEENLKLYYSKAAFKMKMMKYRCPSFNLFQNFFFASNQILEAQFTKYRNTFFITSCNAEAVCVGVCVCVGEGEKVVILTR